MKVSISFRALLLLLSLIVAVAVVTLPAAAQGPNSGSPVAAAASSATAPAPYNPAAAAFAPPKPAPADSSEGPDPDRKWEVEFHGGFMLASNPRGGTGVLPAAGPTFTTVLGSTTRAVPSFFFGDGALLTSQFVTALGDPDVIAGVTGLDTALTSSSTNRQHGGAFGARISRELTPRFGVELNLDFATGGLKITNRALNDITASTSSWQLFFNKLNTPPVCPACTATTVTAVPVVHREGGHQLFFTGGVNVNLVKESRTIPYLSLGLGMVANTGDTPIATLTGNYQYTFGGQTYHATDVATMHYGLDDYQFTGYFGGGVKHYITPRWGIRVDFRDYLTSNVVHTLLDANGSEAQVGAAGSCAGFDVSPDIQDCNNPATGNSTLSGAPFTNFRTFSGDGIRHQLTFTAGIFWRF